MRALKFTLLFLLPFTFSCTRQKSKKDSFLGHLVLFDAYKEQVWPIKDTGFAGYSSLNLFLKNLGYITEENHKPFPLVTINMESPSCIVICSVT